MSYRCTMERKMPTSRRAFTSAAAFLAAAAASVCLLSGCQSALQPEHDQRLGSRYTESLLVRAVMDANFLDHAVSPTVDRGVHEHTNDARVDVGTMAVDPGAGDPTPPAVAHKGKYPAGIPDEFTWTDRIAGLLGGQLNTPEGNFNVSLQECLARAMKHNLDIAVESFNPAIKDYQIIEAQAIFDPTLFGNHQFQNQDEPSILAASSRGINFDNTVGIRETLPSGGQVQISAGDNYFDLKPPIGSTFAASRGHSPFLNLSITHPLLRGFGANVTYANIYLAQRDRSISLATFRRRVITTCGDVEEAYHNLVLATAAVRIQEQLLADTDMTRKRVYDRIPIDADAVSYFQSVSAVESRRAELIRARATLRTASDKLKGLLNDKELDLQGNGLLVPTDRPTSNPMTYNVGEVIDTALRQRTELQEARLQVERADIVVDVTRNDLLPKADVTLSVQSNGNIYENDITNAFVSTINSAHWIDYNAVLKWEIPLGNSEAESRYLRRQTERRQALANLINSAQKVVLDVKTQLREVFASYEEIGARERARAATIRELAGLNQKETIQALSPEFLRLKLDAQQRLATAELAEIQALVNYNIAIARLEQAKGTLLEYNRIALNTEPPPSPINSMWLIGQSIEWKNPFQK